MASLEKSIGSPSIIYSNNVLKRRSISLTTGAPLTQEEIERLSHNLQVKKQISSDSYGRFSERIPKICSSGNVSTLVKSKLRSFGRQIHRHMIETVNVTNDVSHEVPRSAMGDIYFSSFSPSDLAFHWNATHRSRSAKLSLDLEDIRRYTRVSGPYDKVNDAVRSCSASKLQEAVSLSINHNGDGSIEYNLSSKRRLSTSDPQLKDVEHFNEDEEGNTQSGTTSEEIKPFTLEAIRPREVSYDDEGQTWEIYGADQDPDALGQAIENHLEKMMQRKQREQRCFSLVSEFPRQNTCSSKSSSRASNTGEQLLQAARRRFQRRTISSATPISTNASAEELDSDRESQRRRSKIFSYISRILRRSSTSALSGKRRDLSHQDSILECGEQKSDVENAIISAS
ncbi:hypothetical protein Aperf_G00000052418 [Anoplocephala perfoliata]